MKYSDFIKESKDETNIEDAIDFVINHCKKYDLDRPLYRRMKLNQIDYAFIDPSDRVRKSLTGKSYLMLILDEQTRVINKNHPMRNNSSFFTMDRDSILSRFGDMYIIIPIDDSVIAVSQRYDDINYGKPHEFRRLVSVLEDLEVSDDNYNHMIKDIKMAKESGDRYINKHFGDCVSLKDFSEKLKAMCSLDHFEIKYTDIKDIQKNKIMGEAWCKTKCLMIKESEWVDFKEKVKEKARS